MLYSTVASTRPSAPLYPITVGLKRSSCARSSWRNWLRMFSVQMLSESTFTASEKEPHWCNELLLGEGNGWVPIGGDEGSMVVV